MHSPFTLIHGGSMQIPETFTLSAKSTQTIDIPCPDNSKAAVVWLHSKDNISYSYTIHSSRPKLKKLSEIYGSLSTITISKLNTLKDKISITVENLDSVKATQFNVSCLFS